MGMFCKHRLELVQWDVWLSWLPNCFLLLWRYPVSHASAPLGVWMALWLSLSTDCKRHDMGRLGSTPSPLLPLLQKTECDTTNRNTRESPPGTHGRQSFCWWTGQQGGSRMGALETAVGSFQQSQLQNLAKCSYNQHLLGNATGAVTSRQTVNRKQGKGRERQEHPKRTLFFLSQQSYWRQMD